MFTITEVFDHILNTLHSVLRYS